MGTISFEDNLGKIIEILEFIRNNKIPLTEMPNELRECLSKISEKLAILKNANAEIAQLVNIKPDNLRVEAMLSPNLTDKEKRVLERAEQVSRDTKSLVSALEQKEKSNRPPKQQNIKNKSDSTQNPNARKKKLKPLGSDKGWIPL